LLDAMPAPRAADNTPPCGEMAAHPAAIRHGRVVYLAHAVDRMYHDHGSRFHRQYLLNALRLIYRNPVLGVKMPSCGRVSLVHQPQQQRYVAHLLYAPALKRGRCLVLEDAPPLYDVPVALRVPENIRSVRLPLTGQELKMERDRNCVRVLVDEVRRHQVVEFRY
jgi:hypothetical protein